MSKQSWRAGVCVLLTDSVCVCVGYDCAHYATCDGAAGPQAVCNPLDCRAECSTVK